MYLVVDTPDSDWQLLLGLYLPNSLCWGHVPFSLGWVSLRVTLVAFMQFMDWVQRTIMI